MTTPRSHLAPLAAASILAAACIVTIFSLFAPALHVRSVFIPDDRRALSPGAASATITHTYENPSHGCLVTDKDVVKASGYPNLGKTWPKGLVVSGTTVFLAGTAEHQHRASDCGTIFTTKPVTWTTKYIDPKGHVSDVTADLVDSTTLTPTIKTDKEGTYNVDLVYDGATIITDSYEFLVINGNSRLFWVNIGPDGTGSAYTGRINALAFDKSRPGVIYLGSGNGGVWKSTDYGATWTGMTNNKGWPTLAISSLAVALDGSAVYAGTGDMPYFWRNGSDSDAPRGGVGLYKSTDGGVTWINANGSSGGGCTTIGGLITRILIDPSNASIVYAAGANGMYRSTDGGACWKDIKGALGPTGIVFDLAFKPGDSNTVYAAARNFGLLETTDVSVASPVWTTTFSIVPNTFIRGGIGVSPDQPQTVYFDFVDRLPTDQVSIVRSTNQGANWEWLPMPNQLRNCGVCDYNFALAVDPNDANVIFHGDTDVWRFDYPPGGNPALSNWRDWRGPGAGTPNALGEDLHADSHLLVFDPNNPATLYAGTDGGLARFNLAAPSLASWKSLNTGLAIGMFRSLAVRPALSGPTDLAGGLQDIGSEHRIIGSRWDAIPNSGGDGWWVSYDPLYRVAYFNWGKADNGQISNLYGFIIGSAGGTFDNGGMFMSDPYRTGIMLADSAQTTAISTTRNGQLFYAENIGLSVGANWTCIDPTPINLSDKVTALTTARVFPANSDRQYFVGLDSGGVYLVTVPASPVIYPGCGAGSSAGSAQLLFTASSPNGTKITGLAEDPSQPCELYVTAPNSVNSAERVFRLDGAPTTAGCSMTPGAINMAAALPSDLNGVPPDIIHDHAIAVDPLSPTITYIGTDRGLYVGIDNGSSVWTWTRVSTIPTVTVTDIKSQLGSSGSDGTLFASTYGRGVYERIFTAGGGALLKPASLANTINRCQVRDLHGPGTYWNTADVEVDFTYNGDHGDNIHIRPVVTLDGDGAVNDYFIRETHGVTVGQHTVNLQVIYGSQDAPPGLYTNGVRVEIYDGGGTIYSMDCDFAKTWRRDDARSLEVRAEDLVEDGSPAEPIIPITVTLSNGLVLTHDTPFTFVFTQGLTVTLQAPNYRMHGDELRALHYWTLFGHSDNSDSPVFSFALSDDTEAIVRYLALDYRVMLPIVLKSH